MKVKYIALFTFTVTLVFFLSGVSSALEKDLKSEYNKAKEALKSKQYEDAVNLLENIIYKFNLKGKNRENVINKLKEGYFEIGLAHMAAKKFDLSASSFEKGVKWGEEIEKDKLFYSLQYGRAKNLFNQNFFDESIVLLKEIKDNPLFQEGLDARMYICLAFYQQGKYEELIYWAPKLIEEIDNGSYKMEMSLYLSIAFIKTAKNQQALELLQKICESPDTTPATMQNARSWLEHIKKELENSQLSGAASSTHFEISFEGSRDSSLMGSITDIAESAYNDVGRTLDFYPSDKVIIYIYSPKNFQAASATMAWAGACYDAGRLKLPLSYVTGDLSVVKENIYHEYTHLIVDMKSKSSHDIPLWFNEGCAVNCSDGIRTDFTNVMKEIVKTGKPVDLQLVSQYFRSENINIAICGYSYSAYAVKYIIDEKGNRALSEILENVGNGESFNEAFYNVFFVDLIKFNEKFFDWVKNRL